MSDDLSLAERISDAREGAGLTVQEAARYIGVKAATMKSWESGETSPRANRLQMLAGVLNVSLVWLLDGRDDLDPLELSTNSLDSIQQKLEHVKRLHEEMAETILDLESDLHTERRRARSLDRMAQEAMPG